MIQALLVTIYLVGFPYQGNSIILESGNVNDYEVVYPQIIHALPKGGIQRAEPEAKYEDTMQYQFKVNGEPVVLHLERNKGLFSEDYSETHYSPDGREITTSPQVQDHCYYHGRIQNDVDSTAVISACNGLKGHFKHQGETYLIEPLKLSDSEAHAVYKSENIEKGDEAPKTCGVTQTSWETDEPIKKDSLLADNAELDKYLEVRKYVEVIVVVDNTMYMKYKENEITVTTRVHELANIVNMMYKDTNIHVALTGIEIWSTGNKIHVHEDSSIALASFGKWRVKDLLKRKKHDHAQLFTSVDFYQSISGHTYLNSICDQKRSVAVIKDLGENINRMASTIAHELGHNLGMNHDTINCACASNSCIMSGVLSDKPPNEFTNCSIHDHRSFLIKYRPQCILNKPLRTDIVTTALCGNYLVEVGEECDCGSPEDCRSACCDAATCKLKDGAQCDSGVCCEQCKFRAAEEECRAARNDCDLAELCTGQSDECPADYIYANGHPCQNNMGYCYHGTCPTLLKQCIALWGPGTTVSKDECFLRNLKGNRLYHCRRGNKGYGTCEEKDVKCGRLHCEPPNMKPCRVKYEPDDFGMVEYGTKCAEGKICNSTHYCVDIKTVYPSTN